MANMGIFEVMFRNPQGMRQFYGPSTTQHRFFPELTTPYLDTVMTYIVRFSHICYIVTGFSFSGNEHSIKQHNANDTEQGTSALVG
jgi:hypothetical protein